MQLYSGVMYCPWAEENGIIINVTLPSRLLRDHDASLHVPLEVIFPRESLPTSLAPQVLPSKAIGVLGTLDILAVLASCEMPL
jgi:hypothetical protein